MASMQTPSLMMLLPPADEAPHVRAAACTALAFLASHPLSARGDECMTGPYRERLLATGAFTALLRSALIAQAALADSGEVIQEDGPIALLNPNQIVMQAAAVGLMHLCTMVRPGASVCMPAYVYMYECPWAC